jgi:hypothetical protein
VRENNQRLREQVNNKDNNKEKTGFTKAKQRDKTT